MKRIIILAVYVFFLASCGEEASPTPWVNMYDPGVDEEKRSEVCGEIECGQIDYEGYSLLCGTCEDGKYCDQDQKCQENCEHYNCGKMLVDTFTGKVFIECGQCADGQQCGSSNICISDADICGVRNCGKASFTNVDGDYIDVECGTCKDEEYCSTTLNCESKEDECSNKCGTFSIESYLGNTEIECDGCEGDFSYCNTKNACETACGSKECGTEEVMLETNEKKTFTCGSCGDGMNYCDDKYKCKTACESKECGSEEVFKLDGGQTEIACGTCDAPKYCDAQFSCDLGTQSGNYIIGDGIVIDTELGLMWHKSNASDKTQSDAVSYCSSSSVAGFNNWILPDITQLRSIVVGCDSLKTCGVTSGCTDSTCSDDNCLGCTNNGGAGPEGLYLSSELWDYSGDSDGRFWSSSEVPDKVDSFWFLRFSNASIAYNFHGSEYSVICVREID